MPGPLFRFVCTAGTLDGAPEGWVSTMLDEGELALLADDGGLDAIFEVAHRLDLVTVPLLRGEDSPEQQAATVTRYAGSKPLVWVAPAFGEATVAWAHARGPMTLLVESADPLTEDERRRVERFVVILGRQAE
jgi:hypothetical protein